MASLEERIEFLFPGKGRCLIKTALAFASMKESWLTQSELVELLGRSFASSTIRKAFRDLSLSIKSLDGNCYIDVETIKNGERGQPTKKGKLSKAAYERIFDLVVPIKQAPKSGLRGLGKVGRVEIPPLSIDSDKNGIRQRLFFPPNDMMRLVESKIGKDSADRLLLSLVKSGYAKKCDSITETHRWGRPPKNQYQIDKAGLERFVADQNGAIYQMSACLVDPNAEQHRLDDERVYAAEELVRKGDHAGVTQLIQLLSDNSERARLNAARALGNLREKSAIEPLKGMLKDKDAIIRASAVKVLGNIGDISVLNSLKEMLKDPDSWVQEAAKIAIKKLQIP